MHLQTHTCTHARAYTYTVHARSHIQMHIHTRRCVHDTRIQMHVHARTYTHTYTCVLIRVCARARRDTAHLDGKHVVFGRVLKVTCACRVLHCTALQCTGHSAFLCCAVPFCTVLRCASCGWWRRRGGQGMDVVREVEHLETVSDRPIVDVAIADCGARASRSAPSLFVAALVLVVRCRRAGGGRGRRRCGRPQRPLRRVPAGQQGGARRLAGRSEASPPPLLPWALLKIRGAGPSICRHTFDFSHH